MLLQHRPSPLSKLVCFLDWLSANEDTGFLAGALSLSLIIIWTIWCMQLHFTVSFLLLNVSDRNVNKSQQKSSVSHFSCSPLSEIKIPLFWELQRISSSESAKVIVANRKWAAPESLIGVAAVTKGGQGLAFSYKYIPQEFWTIPNWGKASHNIRLSLSVAIGGHKR